MNINYELIGTFPQVEALRDKLPALMAKGGETEIDRRLIETAAQHFYGIDPAEYDNIAAIIDAIKGADQELWVK